jgi:anti-sigma-K factor RskA
VRSSQPQPHSLAGAYVMNALDPADLRRVERHLARCQECADEVADLREVVGCLAAASASRPPAELKARLLARTPMIRQLPPAVGQQQAGAWRYLPRPRWAGSWPKRMRRLAPAPVLAAALALSVAVAALVIAVTGLPGQHGPARQRPADAAITAILTAPDAMMISAAVRTAGAATVVMSRRERALVFAAAGLPALPASRCYELWLMGTHTDRPVGLLPLPSHGMTGPVIARGLRSGDHLGLTVEPASGSPRPTSAMILVLAL